MTKTKSKTEMQTVQLGLLADGGLKAPEGKRTTLELIALSAIQNMPTPEELRYDAKEWESYLSSVRATNGIRDPVEVRPTDGGYILTDGRHRAEAHRRLKIASIPAIVKRDVDSTSAAVGRFVLNAQRKDDTPYWQAVALADAMAEKKLTQAQLAVAAGTSQATISRRLRLLRLPRELAVRVGRDIEERVLEPIFQVIDDAELVEEACRVVSRLKPDVLARAWNVAEAIEAAWVEKGFTMNPRDVDHEIRSTAAYRAGMKGIKAIVITRDNGHQVEYARDVAAYRKVLDAAAAEVAAAEAKASKAAKGKVSKDGKVVKKRSVADRLPEWTTRVQLDLMAKHIPAQVSWPEWLVVEALARFIKHGHGLTSGQDKAAAAAVLGWSEKELEATAKFGLHLSNAWRGKDEDATAGFHALWKKDKAAAMRLVALALFYQGRDFQKQLNGSIAPIVTGASREKAQEIASQAIKDRDDGFKPIGAPASCDGCGKAGTLTVKGWKVCTSTCYRSGNWVKRVEAQRAKGPAKEAGKPRPSGPVPRKAK